MMVAVPLDTPVTTPVDEPTRATVPSLVLHVPPGVASVSAVVAPTHTLVTPEIAAGSGCTVTVTLAVQPNGSVYVMSSVPKNWPVTMPDEEPTVALPLLAVQIPPVYISLSVVVPVPQTFKFPLIGAIGFTVTTCVTIQAVGSV